MVGVHRKRLPMSYELTLPSITVFQILHRPFFRLLRFAGPSSTVAN